MQPPHPPHDVLLSVPARAENVAVVRHLMGAFGEVLSLPRETVEDLRIAVTEACTNVVRHAYDHADGSMDVCIQPHDDGLDVTVIDRGSGVARSPDRAGPGYGLPMIATLADAVQIERSPDHGSSVAMTFRKFRAAPETA